MRRAKIAFFGLFGIQNLGNECTLQAMISNVRERLPGVEIYGICYEPEDTFRRHALSAVPVSWDVTSGFDLRRFMQGAIRELRHWVKAIKILKGTDMVVMTGTGMLTDYNVSTPFHYPYHVFKWATAGKLAGCRVCFVGIGVGPVYQRLSRFFVRSALARADYRSFRDNVSKTRLEKLGFQAERDRVFPDLAFSLPRCILPQPSNGGQRSRTVGLGVMGYWDPHVVGTRDQRAAYDTYLDKMCNFVTWLIEHGYFIRMLQGDVRHDGGAIRDLRIKLEGRGINGADGKIADEDINSVEELLAQLSLTDLVISPRYHNLILALMLNKPVISVSYDAKSDALLEGVGLGKYCQPMADLNVDFLISQFMELEARSEQIREMLRNAVERYRDLLEEQYRLVFGGL